jgi:hypothetical protein
VVDERVYPISRMELANGKINFWIGPLDGPVNLPPRSEVRVHAPDGSLIATAPWDVQPSEIRKLERMRHGEIASVCFPTAFAEVRGWPRQAA